MEYTLYNFSNRCKSYRFLLNSRSIDLTETTGGKVFIFVHRLVLALTDE